MRRGIFYDRRWDDSFVFSCPTPPKLLFFPFLAEFGRYRSRGARHVRPTGSNAVLSQFPLRPISTNTKTFDDEYDNEIGG